MGRTLTVICASLGLTAGAVALGHHLLTKGEAAKIVPDVAAVVSAAPSMAAETAAPIAPLPLAAVAPRAPEYPVRALPPPGTLEEPEDREVGPEPALAPAPGKDEKQAGLTVPVIHAASDSGRLLPGADDAMIIAAEPAGPSEDVEFTDAPQTKLTDDVIRQHTERVGSIQKRYLDLDERLSRLGAR